jgi:hypothetical protein
MGGGPPAPEGDVPGGAELADGGEVPGVAELPGRIAPPPPPDGAAPFGWPEEAPEEPSGAEPVAPTAAAPSSRPASRLTPAIPPHAAVRATAAGLHGHRCNFTCMNAPRILRWLGSQLGNPHNANKSEVVTGPGPKAPIGQKGHPEKEMIVVEEPKQTQEACGHEQTTSYWVPPQVSLFCDMHCPLPPLPPPPGLEQVDASGFGATLAPDEQGQLALAEKRHIASAAVSGLPPAPVATGPKHCGSEVFVFSQAMAFARVWLQRQSAAQAASWLVQLRAMQFQQAANGREGNHEVGGQPASPAVPGIGGGAPLDVPEPPVGLAIGPGPTGGRALPVGAELPAGWPVAPLEEANVAAPEDPPVPTEPPSPVSPSEVSEPTRPPHAIASAIAGPINRAMDFTPTQFPCSPRRSTRLHVNGRYRQDSSP